MDQEAQRKFIDMDTDAYVLALALLVRMSPWKVTVNNERKIVQMVTPNGVASWSFYDRHMHLFDFLPVDTNIPTETVDTMQERVNSVIQTMDRFTRQLHSTR